MATNTRLAGKLISATKQFKKTLAQHPWSLVMQQTVYDDALYHSAFRSGTMPTTVKLYYPILKAVEMYMGFQNVNDPDFLMVSKPATWQDSTGKTVRGKEYFLEILFADGTGTVYHRKGDDFRISNMDDDGTNGPALEFSQMSLEQLAGVYLLAMPEILELDTSNKVQASMDSLKAFLGDYASWTTEADIPDLAKESAYYLDAVFCYANDHAKWSFASASTASIAEQVEDNMTSSGFKGAEVVCSNSNVAFRYASSNGKRDGSAKKTMTIANAKAVFGAFSAHRKWTPYEVMMIPYFDDNMPVMEETIKIANAIFGTRFSVDPICQVLWRGVTGFGKSTGVRQLACILHMPLLIQTCFPNMEVGDFKSSYVPESEDNGVEVNAANVVMPADAEIVTVHPLLAKAVAYLSAMEREDRDTFLSGDGFYMNAMMDSESASELLLGEANADLGAAELCKLYSDTVCYFQKKPLLLKIAHLENGDTEEKPAEHKDNKPAFKHVMSNYIKALINGYMIEIQEPSRIRDAGVLVGLNEYDKAGARIHLMNGSVALRHKDALVIATDNVGYCSCRPLDPSTIRRFGFIIDSNELSEQLLKDRVRRNTGCTDEVLLDRCFKLWKTVKEYCEQNSITEGSVSPVELTRFVQMVLLEGEDSLESNLRCCVINKASSSPDDQRDILTMCGLS